MAIYEKEDFDKISCPEYMRNQEMLTQAKNKRLAEKRENEIQELNLSLNQREFLNDGTTVD